MCQFALAPVDAHAAAPPVAAAAADLLQSAQKCYATGDMGCVLRLLQGEPAPDAVGAVNAATVRDRALERWRLLAFACARLDRHDLARGYFVQWLQLDPSQQLDREATPPLIWRDYAAAWLQVHGGQLDLRPVVDTHPQLTAPTPQPKDWPKFVPPPRSGRDTARDFVLHMSACLALPTNVPTQLAKTTVDHLGLSIGLELEPLAWLRAGLLVHPVRWNDGARSRLRNDFGLQAHLRLWHVDGKRFELQVMAGGALETTVANGASSAVGAGLRYHHQPTNSALGWTVSVADRRSLGGGGDNAVLMSIGVALRPAAKGSVITR
ncbi:MAG: hypothetical protein EXR77_06430 [Myxococcales bacterium]|nr:hypothetical protein [Myxococcales bacterium]